MPGGNQERFNVWAAYVDLFSNMLAFILMIGLIAATSGGAISGTKHACDPVPSAHDTMAEDISDLAASSGLSDANLEPGPNCEIVLLPESSSDDWIKGSAHLRFKLGTAEFCWSNPREDARCAPVAISEPKPKRPKKQGEQLPATGNPAMDKFCDALKSLLDAIVEMDDSSSEKTGYRVAIIGHASEDWQGQSLWLCSNGMLKNENRAEAAYLCNYQLSLQRAQSTYSVCANYWIDKYGDPKDKNRGKEMQKFAYTDILLLSGQAFLDSRVKDAVGDGKTGNSAATSHSRERMITVSVFTPGGHS